MILQYKLKHNRILHMVSVILALVAGTVVAAAMGAADFSSVHDAKHGSSRLSFSTLDFQSLRLSPVYS